jgi:CrcB protein
LLDLGPRILALSLGGALGVNARYWLASAIDRWVGAHWPWATFAINVSGSFLIGAAATMLSRRDPHSSARLFLVTGFLGGYTTFSTYAFEIRSLWSRGLGTASLAYGIGSVLAGVLGVALGVAAAQALDPSVIEQPMTGAEVEGQQSIG